MPMRYTILDLFATRLPSNVPAIRCEAQGDDWMRLAQELRTAGARLLTLWGTDERDRNGSFRVRAAWLTPEGVVVAEHRIPDAANSVYLTRRYPDRRRESGDH